MGVFVVSVSFYECHFISARCPEWDFPCFLSFPPCVLEYHLTSGGYLAPGHVLDDIWIPGGGRDYYVL